MKDRELIEELETLEEVIGWLEEKGRSDLREAIENVPVDKEEISDWMSEASTIKTDKISKH